MEKLNPKFAKYSEHLKLLGYEVETIAYNCILATKGESKVSFYISDSSVIYTFAIVSYLMDSKKYYSNKQEVLEIVNEINEYDLVKCRIGNDEDDSVSLRLCFLYFGDYVQSSFSRFVNTLETSNDLIMEEFFDKLKNYL